jgi:hypothetical protein
VRLYWPISISAKRDEIANTIMTSMSVKPRFFVPNNLIFDITKYAFYI